VINTAFFIIDLLILAYFAVINGTYLLLLFLSYFSIIRYRRLVRFEQWRRVIQSPRSLPVTIIAPAYNEEATIVESVKSLLMLQYPMFEALIVNDGSDDRTMEILKSTFDLRKIPVQLEEKLKCQDILGVYRSPTNPNLVVVDKSNGGKADALNAGVNVSRYPLVCAIDADSLIEGRALLRVTQPFLEEPRTTVAVGGVVRVANGCHIEGGRVLRVRLSKSWLAMFQTVEYLRAFLFGRTGWAAIRSLLIISGAFGVFKKSAVIEVGGYSHNTVGEDMELVVRMHHLFRRQGRKYQIHFLPDTVCWTQVPESLKVLARQRNRWHRGLMDSLLWHRGMLFNPKYGTVGMIAFPFFLFFEMLGPIVELAGYVIIPLSYALGILNVQFFFLFLALAILLGVVLSTGSVAMEQLLSRRYLRIGELAKLVLGGILENFGYRQLHTWWRFTGIVDYFRKKTTWGKMERKAFATVK